MTRADDQRCESSYNLLPPIEAAKLSIYRFACCLLKVVGDQNPGNVVVSPLCASLPLTMVCYGGCEETAEQFRTVLCLPVPESVGHTGFQSLIDKVVNKIHESKLFLSNEVFVDQSCPVKECYKQFTETYFGTVVRPINFSDSEEAANTINAWVRVRTNNHVKNLISPDDLSGATMFVISAGYLKVQWENTFDSAETKHKPFYVTEEVTKEVSMMYRQGSYRYAELPDMKGQMLDMPFKGGEVSMLVIVPDEIDGLPQLLEKLLGTSLSILVRRPRERAVDLFIPKFTAEVRLDLKFALKHMGLEDAFDEGKAEFTEISAEPMSVSHVLHTAYVEFSEEGTQAVAPKYTHLTSYEAGYEMLDPIIFNVDRPSFYAIYHVPSSLLLFSGLIRDF